MAVPRRILLSTAGATAVIYLLCGGLLWFTARDRALPALLFSTVLASGFLFSAVFGFNLWVRWNRQRVKASRYRYYPLSLQVLWVALLAYLAANGFEWVVVGTWGVRTAIEPLFLYLNFRYAGGKQGRLSWVNYLDLDHSGDPPVPPQGPVA